eukprot:2078850-Amphidinium_carterae.1
MGRRVLVFIDNDSTRFACIRGYSDSEASNEMLKALALLEARFPARIFFARVPSWSNPADGASRDRVAEVAGEFKAAAVDVTAPASVE